MLKRPASHYKKSEKTQQRIFQSALQLMQEVGYQGATIRGICSRAGVSPATFYLYYESKSDLLHEFFHASDRYFGRDLYRRLEKMNFYEQYDEYLSAYAQLNIDTGLESMRVLYNPENNWFSDYRPMQATLELILDNGRHQGILPPQLDMETCVKSIFIMLRGVCFDWCIYNGEYDLMTMMRRQGRLLLGGILSGGAEKPSVCPPLG